MGGTAIYYNLSTAGRYDLLGTINGCTVVSNVVTITQIGKPVINSTVTYSANPYCIGTISVTSNSANTYQWFFPNNYAYYLTAAGSFTGQTGTSFVAALADIQLPWRVSATNCAGTTNTNILVNAKTNYVPVVSILENNIFSGPNGCNPASSLTGVSATAMSYQWYRFDNNAWVTQTGWNTQSISASYSTVRKDYKVDARNDCGTASSASVRLKTICSGNCGVPSSACSNLREESEDILPALDLNTNTFRLFPNPNKGSFTIISVLETSYIITDILGKNIANGKLNIGENTFSIHLPSGLYLLVSENNKTKIVVE